MGFYCTLCEKEVCYVSRFCSKCRKLKWYLNIYNERVYQILDNVLSRTDNKQHLKESEEIKKEIKTKLTQIKRGSEVDN
tara:strand:+ start:120 stop:356 length:237 start_codon:yes stop_codon:yes gene_type:complete